MVLIKESELAGLACKTLENESLKLWFTCDVGPRILGLSFRGGENLLAELPEHKIVLEELDDYSLRGGHRLWYAPEVPETTYITDDLPVEIIPGGTGLRVIQEIEPQTGIQKSWLVTLDEKEASVELIHTLSNRGDEPFELAPWVITQFRPGGKSILPLKTDFDDPHGLQSNRNLVLWPYTHIDSPHLILKDNLVSIVAEVEEGAVKIGAPNPLGWLAYALDGTIFVKRAEYQHGATYLDRGASSQIYCNPDFIEVETLGPVVNLAPGESVDHQETWQLYSEDNSPKDIAQLLDLIQN